MGLLPIGELARRSGVPITTLRYYDEIGLLVPSRLPNNHRVYPPEALGVLQLIQLCRMVGCTLEEVAGIIAPDGGDPRRSVARRKLHEVDHRIDQLQVTKAALRHLSQCTHGATTVKQCHEAVREAIRAVGSNPREERAAVVRAARRAGMTAPAAAYGTG